MTATSIQQIRIELGHIDDQAISMTFNQIPACPEGFLMGSRGFDANEEPIHRVIIPEDFWMAETPVTQAQFSIWTQAKGIEHQNFFRNKLDLPAEDMTWTQACEYCDWLTKHFSEQLPAISRFATLPTEAHWEYACRAGTNTEYYTGDGEVGLDEAGHYATNSTQPVRTRKPNEFGLYDMHGNIWEWCLDRWDATAYRRRWDRITADEIFALNEQFGDQDENPNRVMRGGSWGDSADWCRSAVRPFATGTGPAIPAGSSAFVSVWFAARHHGRHCR